MGRLSAELCTEIEQLKRDLALRVVDETYEPGHFGNASLTMTSSTTAIRFVRDRDQLFLDIADSSGQWVDANKILQRANIQLDPTQPAAIDVLIMAICSNWGEIRNVLA